MNTFFGSEFDLSWIHESALIATNLLQHMVSIEAYIEVPDQTNLYMMIYSKFMEKMHFDQGEQYQYLFSSPVRIS